MELKLQWLQSRRQQVVKDLTECDAQSSALVNQLITENKRKDDELLQHKKESKNIIEALEGEVRKIGTQVKSLQSVIVAKEEHSQVLKKENQKLRSSQQSKTKDNQSMITKILQLEHEMKVCREEAEKKLIELKQELQQVKQSRGEEIEKMTKKHEQQLISQEQFLAAAHRDEILALKKTHLGLVQKLQAEHQALSSKSSELSKQSSTEYSRVTVENTRLLAQNNELKHKILDLQGSLGAQQQQMKIYLKEHEISKEHMRRELQLAKEERDSYKTKNKGLTDSNDELSWQVRELTLKREEDLKKMKQEVDKSFNQVLVKAEQERKEISKENQKLKEMIQLKENNRKELQQMAMKLKSIVKEQQTELTELKYQKQSILSQVNGPSSSIRQVDELKTELIRKNCQTEVLQSQVKRLKAKVNSIATAYEQYVKMKEVMQKENKMLLSQIVFLRQKQKKQKQGRRTMKNDPNSSNILNELNSEQSQVCEDVQQYKKVIEYMTEQMNQVCRKVVEKDNRIQKMEAIIKRYELQLKNQK